jgi:hypothetical protein
MTQPKVYLANESIDIGELIETLFQRLVSRNDPEGTPEPDRPNHPVSVFRRLRNERKLDGRGLRKNHALKNASNSYLWAPNRVAENGKILAIDKIEIGNSPERTFSEIDKARSAAAHVRDVAKTTEWAVLIDPLDDASFAGLSPNDRADMKAAIDQTKVRVMHAGGRLLTSPEEVPALVDELDAMLLT